MQFNSIAFIIFIPLVSAGYYLIPPSRRWLWLLSASLLFYLTAVPWFMLPLLVTAGGIYASALMIDQSRNRNNAAKNMAFFFGLATPLVLLVSFKYLPFFSESSEQIARALDLNYPRFIIELITPLGISYYSFQAISYVVEVKRGKTPAERNLGILLLYLVFFPRVVAGPIERPDLIHQFREPRPFNREDISTGIELMAFGFFKKLVIADRLAIPVNEIYGNAAHYHGVYLLLATFFFAVQVYTDFSGYTDMALGSARLVGIRLTDNFRHPYGAPSLRDFWRRWHITLTSWFRDYLYIPLGGNRVAPRRRDFNVFITFLASGMWHGAGGTFIVWGAVHGLMIIIGSLTRPLREVLARLSGLSRAPAIRHAIGVITTSFLVGTAWIFFRAESLSGAISIIRNILGGIHEVTFLLITRDADRLRAIADVARKGSILGFARESYRPEMIIAVVSIMALWIAGMLSSRRPDFMTSGLLRWPLVLLTIAFILLFGMFSAEQFIYFRF
jgi:D-alanyl-lipoteichoic acid acyltransferase DltB (MBOAT superfamily)